MASALINPCDITTTGVSNTGIECDSVLGLPKGLFLVPASASWSDEDIADPVEFFRTKIHAAGTARFYPVLDEAFDFTVGRDGDVTEANPVAGTTDIIRLGGLTLTYTFKKGGLCRAKNLLSFFNKGYRFIPVDTESQFQVRLNTDGTYSGLKANSITPNFNPMTASTAFKHIIVITMGYDEYVRHSKLLKSDTDIDFNGLIDVKITKAAAASTTKLKISVATECAGTDLIDQYGNALADLDLYIVTNKATGAVVTPTAIAIVNGIIELTGTYVSGQTYITNGSAPSVWLANNIEGYDSSDNADAEHLIP